MPYVNSDGSVEQSRSVFRFSIFADIFWTVINAIGLFFSTLTNPTAPLPSGRDSSQYNRLNNTKWSSSSNSKDVPKPKGGGTQPRQFGARVATVPKPCNTGR
jgi:hypothetical protein